jgi:hypothetical protein
MANHAIRPGNSGIQASPNYQSVTPGAAQLPFRTRAIWVGGAGNLVVTCPDTAANITFVIPAAGVLLPIQTDFILGATTATLIVALN